MGRAPATFFKHLATVVAQALTELSETVSCASVANYFLERASKEGRALTALQVNYLLYLAQGWHLAYFDKPLLNEVFLAGRQGIKPMHAHRALAKWGSQGIREPFRSGPRTWDVEFSPKLPAEGMAFLDALWNAYASFGGTQLAMMCTAADSPWARTWQGGDERAVNHSLLKEHFQAQLQTYAPQRAV
jgi:uncharacterized phage-associated protein